MFYVVLLMIGVVALALYVLVFLREVPGAAEERLGTLEPLPPDVGKWKQDDDSDDARSSAEQGLRREVRIWHEPPAGLFGREKLVRQVRYRDADTGAIVRIGAEEPLPARKRRKQRG